jgi:hypothetical protein
MGWSNLFKLEKINEVYPFLIFINEKKRIYLEQKNEATMTPAEKTRFENLKKFVQDN